MTPALPRLDYDRIAMICMLRRQRDHRRVFWAWLLALALVGSQVLGMAHALAHASTPSTSTSSSTTAALDGDADAGAADVFGHDVGGAPCALWSGLLGAAALTATFEPHAAPLGASARATWPAVPAHVAQATAAFDARGPPAATPASHR